MNLNNSISWKNVTFPSFFNYLQAKMAKREYPEYKLLIESSEPRNWVNTYAHSTLLLTVLIIVWYKFIMHGQLHILDFGIQFMILWNFISLLINNLRKNQMRHGNTDSLLACYSEWSNQEKE